MCKNLQSRNNKIDEIVLSYNPEIGYEGAIEFEKNLKKFLKFF